MSGVEAEQHISGTYNGVQATLELCCSVASAGLAVPGKFINTTLVSGGGFTPY